MVFSAGLGTRLKPLTDHLPKALVRVDGRELLQIVLEKIVAAGATEVVVNVHHFAEQILGFLSEHDFGVPIAVSDERNKLLDTGGGLRHALGMFSDAPGPILIHNVDVLSNADLREFYALGRGYDAALLVSERQSTRYLLFDDEMRLRGWTNVQTGEVRSPVEGIDVSTLHRYAFSGIHLFSPSLSVRMQAYPEVFPIMDFYLSECVSSDIRGVLAPELRLLDVGKVASLSAASDFLAQLQ